MGTAYSITLSTLESNFSCLFARRVAAGPTGAGDPDTQHQLISFVVERLRVPWRSEPAGVARPFIIAIAIDHGATRSQEAAVVEWPSSRNSVAHQRCLRRIEICRHVRFKLYKLGRLLRK